MNDGMSERLRILRSLDIAAAREIVPCDRLARL